MHCSLVTPIRRVCISLGHNSWLFSSRRPPPLTATRVGVRWLSDGARKGDLQRPNDEEEAGEMDISHMIVSPPASHNAAAGEGRHPADVALQERRRRTEEFISLVSTTRDAQLWRDLLMSALRLRTLQSHHIERMLRGVGVAPTTTSHTDDDDDTEHKKKENPNVDSSSPSPPMQPTERLGRVVEAVQFIVEQEKELQWGGEDEVVGVPPPTTTPSLLTRRVLAQLLAMLLRGAHTRLEHCLSGGGAAVPPPHQFAYCTFADIWQFLAWMERQGIHLPSEKTIDNLEAVVDGDFTESKALSPPHTTTSNTNNNNNNNTVETTLLQRHENRLQYLKRERLWLYSQSSQSHAPQPQQRSIKIRRELDPTPR